MVCGENPLVEAKKAFFLRRPFFLRVASLQRRTEDKTDGVGLVVTKKENASNQDDDVKTN